MIFYLSSPRNNEDASLAEGMPVLLSYACCPDWMKYFQAAFGRIMIDSGAYSEFKTGKSVDLAAYADWSAQWAGQADAIAGLDDIAGDWRKSMANFEAFPGGFPTFHTADPMDALGPLVDLAVARKQWLGLGISGSRSDKKTIDAWIRSVLEHVPDHVHVHLFAGGAFTYIRRIDSTDSTYWWRQAQAIRCDRKLRHLTTKEAMEIVIKQYIRAPRMDEHEERKGENEQASEPQPNLFG